MEETKKEVVQTEAEKEVFNVLIMIQKMIRYALQTGVAVGGVQYFNNAEVAIEFLLGSAGAMAALVGIVNFVKVKFGKKLPVKFLPFG